MLKILENLKCLCLYDSVKMLKYNKELLIKRFKERLLWLDLKFMEIILLL